MQVILASRSPRRLMLLQAAGLAVEVRPSHIDESPMPGESVETLVERLSREKALACQAAEDIPVIAADTLVALGNKTLGQPEDIDHARAMLKSLSGLQHRVLTGVCVRLNDRILQQRVSTLVHFRPLHDEEIETYLSHNEVLDKAGAYAVQGGAASFIESIDGPLDNVIGLPVHTTLHMIAEITFSGTST